MFIDVRTPGENIESPRMERQLQAHCAREEVSLAALTNGLRWLLISVVTRGRPDGKSLL